MKKKFEYVRNKKVKTASDEKFIEYFCERFVKKSFEEKYNSKLDDVD